MGEYRDKHLQWAREFLTRHDPEYRFRWEVYFAELERLLAESSSFLDAGCGKNHTVLEAEIDGFKIGVDTIMSPGLRQYCRADLGNMPFATASFDLIGCRFVIEHLENPRRVFQEFSRLLRPGGFLLTQTTNKFHPTVFLSRLLPEKTKQYLIRRIYHCPAHVELPIYHHFNRPGDFVEPLAGLVPVKRWYIEDLHLESKSAFYVSYLYHWLTEHLNLQHWRSCLTTLWQKPAGKDAGNLL